MRALGVADCWFLAATVECAPCHARVQVSGVHKSMPATVTYKPDTPSSTEQQVPAGLI